MQIVVFDNHVCAARKIRLLFYAVQRRQVFRNYSWHTATRKLITVSIFTPFYQQKRLNGMIFTPIGVLHTSKKLSYFKI